MFCIAYRSSLKWFVARVSSSPLLQLVMWNLPRPAPALSSPSCRKSRSVELAKGLFPLSIMIVKQRLFSQIA
jgi:hypothetical protein